jgi:hypothetical protein
MKSEKVTSIGLKGFGVQVDILHIRGGKSNASTCKKEK